MALHQGRWLPALLLFSFVAASLLANAPTADATGSEGAQTGVDIGPGGPEADGAQGLEIYISGQKQQTTGGMTRFVTGIFHNVKFDVGGSGNVELVMYLGGTPPAVRTIQNYYHFIYNESGPEPTWWDSEWNYTPQPPSKCGGNPCPKPYSPYIDLQKSSRTTGVITFYVAVDGEVADGDWTLIGGPVGGAPAVQQPIRLVRFQLTMAKSEPVILFEIPPFTGAQQSSGQQVRIDNEGNVPFILSYKPICPGLKKVTVAGTGLMDIGASGRALTVSIDVDARSPAKILCVIDMIAELPSGIRLTGGRVNFEASLNLPVDVTVRIARPGFDLAECGSMVFQYRTNHRMRVAESVTLLMYGTGSVTAKFYWEIVKPEYGEVSNVLVAGAPANEPITIPLKNVPPELEIQMTLKPTVDDVDIFMKYVAEQEGGSGRCTFMTTIVVIDEPDILGAVVSDPVALSVIGAAIVSTAAILISAYALHARRKRQRLDLLREERKRLRRERRGGTSKLSEAEILARREEIRHRRMKKRADRRRRKWLKQHDESRQRKGRRR